jgi:ABC-type dipeptide/oligopeptide/nickel transport system permease component
MSVMPYRFWLVRLLWHLTLIIGVITASFWLFYVVPGDPARLMLGPNASEESVERLRSSLGLNKDLKEQLLQQYGRLIRLDLGKSIVSGRSVSIELARKFPMTLLVGALASMMALGGSYLVNILVFFAPSLRFVTRIARAFVMVPMFFVAVVLAIVFGVWLKIIPLTGTTLSQAFPKVLLPAFVAGLYPLALMIDTLNDKIQRTKNSPWIISHAAMGFPRLSVFHSAILRPNAVPWLAVLMNQLSLVFLSSFVLEIIFTMDGVGPLLLMSIQQKDFPMLQGIIIVNCLFFVVVSFCSERLYRFIDPRIRFDVPR